VSGRRNMANVRVTPPRVGVIPPRVMWKCEGDECPCRQGRSVHPPVLMAFDPESGTYKEAWLRCAAIWARDTAHPRRGQICGDRAAHQVADVVVCEYHYRRIRQWTDGCGERDAAEELRRVTALHQEKLRLEQEQAAELHRLRAEGARQERDLAREAASEARRLAVEVERERVRAAEAARAEVSLVYFVRRESDGLIKIGTSRGLAARMRSLKRHHGSLRLLAVEGGERREEAVLHRKFAALRVEGEWFRPELPLLEYVYALMKERPLDPDPKLPPIVERREIGKVIWKIKVGPLHETRRRETELKFTTA
jgi:hypothetical protein